MIAKVIQGVFLGGLPKLPPSPRSEVRLPPLLQTKTAAPPATALAGHPPGPPAPAFAGRPGAVERQGADGAFAVEAGALGLAAAGGRPLPEALRGKMEAALGADFAEVRVHVGSQAERIGAIAFTLGSDIYFAPGRYQPDTVHGQQLLGHELAHVVQQRSGRVRNPLGSGIAVVQDHALEAEADRLGQRAAAHRVTAQAKMPPGAAAQPSAPVRVSPPVAAGPGRYRLTAGTGGRPVGSVMVHARERGAVEVTDLHVAEIERGHGVGQMLLASAARTGQQFGKSKVTLAAQDSGSGRLTRWYKEMGFAQTGVNRRGYAQLEAPISRLLAGALQRRESPASAFGNITGRVAAIFQATPARRIAAPPLRPLNALGSFGSLQTGGSRPAKPGNPASVVQRMKFWASGSDSDDESTGDEGTSAPEQGNEFIWPQDPEEERKEKSEAFGWTKFPNRIKGYKKLGVHETAGRNVASLVKWGPHPLRIDSANHIGKGPGFYVTHVGNKTLFNATNLGGGKGWGDSFLAIYIREEVRERRSYGDTTNHVNILDQTYGDELCYYVMSGGGEIVIPERCFSFVKVAATPADCQKWSSQLPRMSLGELAQEMNIFELLGETQSEVREARTHAKKIAASRIKRL